MASSSPIPTIIFQSLPLRHVRKRSSRAWSYTATPFANTLLVRFPGPASRKPARQKETLRCGRDEKSGYGKSAFKTSENPDLTPLINCMFLLLVFLHGGGPLSSTPRVLSVDLPGGEGESRATKDMNIVIDPDQTIQVNGEGHG